MEENSIAFFIYIAIATLFLFLFIFVIAVFIFIISAGITIYGIAKGDKYFTVPGIILVVISLCPITFILYIWYLAEGIH